MDTQTERLRQEIRHETTRIVIEILLGAAALLGVGIAIGRFVLFHS